MKNYCDICFTCNDTEFCHSCSQRCVEKWRLYNEQTTKQ